MNTVLAPGTSGTLVLAEATGGWSATLNGRPLAKLAAPVDGWAQGFTLPAGGGRLVVTRTETARNLSLGAEAVALLVALVLALPGSRSSVPAPAAEPRAEGAREPAPRRPGPAEARPQPRAGDRRRGARPGGDRRRRAPRRATHRPIGGRRGSGDTLGATPGRRGQRFGPASAPRGPAPGRERAEDPQTPASRTADPTPDRRPRAAAPRRGRGQHAARHGKPSRRSRGEG